MAAAPTGAEGVPGAAATGAGTGAATGQAPPAPGSFAVPSALLAQHLLYLDQMRVSRLIRPQGLPQP